VEWQPTEKKSTSKNIYHRYLNLPFEVTKHPHCDTNPDTMQHYDINPWRCKNIESWLNSLELYTCHSEVFFTPAGGGELPVHADDTTLDNRAKINLTYGPEGGRTRWWESSKTQQISGVDEAKEMFGVEGSIDERFSEREHHNLVAKKEDCTLVHEASTNHISLVNVGQLHSTYNPDPTEGRWTLCFVPASDKIQAMHGRRHLTFEEALEVFAPYIQGDKDGN